MNKPLISIIIPTLQEETVLERTLSQFTPELRNRFSLEIIVSDGGSKDNTLTTARRNSDKVIEATIPSTQTIAVGRNIGASVSEGELLIFIDADVLIDNIEQFFMTVTKLISKNKVVAATCNVRVYQSDEKILDTLFHQFYNKYFYLLNVIGIGMGRGECQIIRKSVFDAVGGFDERMAAGEDFDMFTRLKKIGKVMFIHSLTVRESPRRYRKLGYFYVSCLWFMNAMSVWLFRKPVVHQWKAIR